jgi:spermidine synthase
MHVDRSNLRHRILLLCVLIVATCGLVYELITATLASYLLGDSVTHFSLVIGVYLSAMGLGSWLSRFVERRLCDLFVRVQVAIALLGGFSATLLFLAFAHLQSVRPLLFGLLIAIGTLVGLEIPLLMRLLPSSEKFKDVVARVLALDYIGALLASLAFPLIFLPKLGLIQTALGCGLFNALVALCCARIFVEELVMPRLAFVQAGLAVLVLSIAMFFGQELEDESERRLFEAPVVFSQRTPYQRITLTQRAGDLRLYLSGNLQFSSRDEYRYHEALVHPLLAMIEKRERVLILGGGDGLALREILAHPGVSHVDLVDLDPAMTKLFAEHPSLAALNHRSLVDERVTIHNDDAMNWLATRLREPNFARYEAIFIDLPDPNNFALGKLYTQSFYQLIDRALAPQGAAVIQASSPYLTPRAFWCIERSIASVGLHTLPYHALVPAFGDWGFVLATHERREVPQKLVPNISRRYLSDATLVGLFAFPLDQSPPTVEVNRLHDQLLVHYYEEDLRQQLGKPEA